MHLEGRALHWHQFYANANGGLAKLQWSGYLDELRRRFGKSEFSDPMSELVSLRQTGTVEEYYEQFLSLLNALQLSPDYALSIFTSNLKTEVGKTIRLFFLKTITHAFNLAKQLESLNTSTLQKPYIPYKTPPPTPPNITTTNQSWKPSQLPPLLPTPTIPPQSSSSNNPKLSINTPIKSINSATASNTSRNTSFPTRQEKEERRRKGLCMWCGAKYSSNHSCVKT